MRFFMGAVNEFWFIVFKYNCSRITITDAVTVLKISLLFLLPATTMIDRTSFCVRIEYKIYIKKRIQQIYELLSLNRPNTCELR